MMKAMRARCRHQTIQVSAGQHTQTQPAGSCQICKAERHEQSRYRRRLLGGLCLPYFLASLDLTIVSTAAPFITSYFNKLDQLNWVVTAYTLTATAFIPAFGQLADIFGRHHTLQLAMMLMWIGSTLAAAAQTWGMLLLGRAIQGMGSAGILNIILIILADKVSLRQNATNNATFSFIQGISFAVGPVMGGYLTNIAFVSHFLIFYFLRHDLLPGIFVRGTGSFWSDLLRSLMTIDLIGIVLFVIGIGLIILGTTWGGSTYSWSSVRVLTPIIIGAICVVLFLVFEYVLEFKGLPFGVFQEQIPLLSMNLFSRRDTLIVAMIQFATGAAQYAVFYFIGVYFTLVEGYPSSKAGIQLLYYIPGLAVGVLLTMALCNFWPAQTFYPLLWSGFTEVIGISILIPAISDRNISLINGMLALTGVGTGSSSMPATLHMAGIWAPRLAPAMSLMRFSNRFGGTIGLSIMGSVYNNKLNAGSNENGIEMLQGTQSLDATNSLSVAQQEIVRMAGKNAIKWAFVSLLPIIGVAFVATLFLGNVWIRSRARTQSQEPDLSSPSNVRHSDDTMITRNQAYRHNEAIYVPYIYALLQKDINSYKRVQWVEMSRPEVSPQRENIQLAERPVVGVMR